MKRLSKKAVIKGLRNHNGNVAAVARDYGITRQAVLNFIERHGLKPLLQECRETMLDHAETSLFERVLAGDGWAVCFFLKTQGRTRGYNEKQDEPGNGRLTQDEILKRIIGFVEEAERSLIVKSETGTVKQVAGNQLQLTTSPSVDPIPRPTDNGV